MSEQVAAPFAALLALLDCDTELDQLRHRRAHLPESEQLSALERQRQGIVSTAASSEAERSSVLGRITTLEEESEETSKRIAAIESQLRAGAASSFRDQTAMDHEIASLRERRDGLDDEELALMEELEPLNAAHAQRTVQLGELDEALSEARIARDNALRAVDHQIAATEPQRVQLAAAVDAALLAEYERVRQRSGAAGAARLVTGRCSGCHLALSASELDAIKKAPPGSVWHCEQCGRLLVPQGS